MVLWTSRPLGQNVLSTGEKGLSFVGFFKNDVICVNTGWRLRQYVVTNTFTDCTKDSQ